MNEFWTLLFRFSFGLLCHSGILYLMISPKYSSRVTLGTLLGAFVFTSLFIVPLILFVHNINIIFVIEAFASLAIYCAVYLCLSKGSVWKNLFIFFAYASLFLFFLTLSSCVSQMFFGNSHWATVIGRTVFMALYTLWLLWKKPTAQSPIFDHIEKGWTSLAIFSVFSGLTIYITALTFLILKVATGIRLAVSTILFLLIGSAYMVASHTIVLMSQKYEAQEAEAQRKLLEDRIATEREFAIQANTHRHDLHHHISLINDYLKREDIEGMKAYLSQYKAELDADTPEVYCENAAANAILCHIARCCSSADIPFSCQAVIPRTISLPGPDLAIVLGNVLENAWEASRWCEAPWICVNARTRSNALLIEVRNAVSGESRFEGDLPASTKPGGGAGLKNVNRVLEKHDGILNCFRTGDTFFTQIMILR